MLEKDLTLTLFGDNVLDLQEQIGRRNEIAERDRRVRYLDEFFYVAPRLR